MRQASAGDGLSLDAFPLHEDCLAASEVDVGRCQIAEALVVAPVVAVGDDGVDLGLMLLQDRNDLIFRETCCASSSGPSCWPDSSSTRICLRE